MVIMLNFNLPKEGLLRVYETLKLNTNILMLACCTEHSTQAIEKLVKWNFIPLQRQPYWFMTSSCLKVINVKYTF